MLHAHGVLSRGLAQWRRVCKMARDRELTAKKRRLTDSDGQALTTLQTSSEEPAKRASRGACPREGGGMERATEIGCCRFRRSSCRSRAGPTSGAAHPSFEMALRASSG